ncbi:PBP1A family penicillin-binding protein [bacterium]|nr:PBP1A family penicillin-binding protein [bacterium]
MSISSYLKKGFLFLVYTLIIFFVMLLGSVTGLFIQIKRQLPDLSILKEYEPSLITRVYDSNGQSLAHFCLEKRILVPYVSFPSHMIQAVIAVEDARFYKHNGLDWGGISRAAIRNIRHKGFMEGGSTITQQLTRSLLLHSEKTIIRKLKEALLALEVEKLYSKDKILELYLNQIYFGNGAYGIESAARTFFGVHAEDLGLTQSALLAGLPKAPNLYNPTRHPDRALSRRNYVLKRMLEEGYIDYNQYQSSINTSIDLSKNKDQSAQAPYFVEYIRSYLEGKYGATMLYRGGLKVYTTLDPDLQKYAEDALKCGLEELDKRQGFRNIQDIKGKSENPKGGNYEDIERELIACIETGILPKNRILGEVVDVSSSQALILMYGTGIKGILGIDDASWTGTKSLESIIKPADKIYVRILERLKDPDNKAETLFRLAMDQVPEVQGAILAIDPHTGHIKAMAGGYDFETSKFNRAVQAKRQPGSAFKPFIYTTALKQGYTLADIFIDSPIIYQDDEQEKDWKPVNYYQKFYGPTTLREALEKSRNVITIKVLKKAGIDASVETAKDMGIVSPLSADLSLALGSSGVSLLELTSAYGVFATGGIKTMPVAILKIEGPDGRILEEHHPHPERAIDEQTAYLMTQALRGVIDHGTGWKAKALARPLAGKTGTTNNYIDAWFIGFSPDIVAGVWIGFDEYKSLGDMETGSKAASPVWVNFMKGYLDGKTVKDFPIPPGIEFVSIDRKTGLLATGECNDILLEAFRDGTAPKKLCKAHQITSAHFVQMDMELSKDTRMVDAQDIQINFPERKARSSD